MCQDPVRARLRILFTPTRYQDPVLWVSLEMFFTPKHSRPQSPRSFWPAAGNRELWEQPFQACAVDADCVRPDGQNSVISIVISKWLLPELSFSDRWSRGTRLWERDWPLRGTKILFCGCGLKCFSPLRGTKILFCGCGLKCFSPLRGTKILLCGCRVKCFRP